MTVGKISTERNAGWISKIFEAGKEISVYGLTMKAFRILCKVLPHRLNLR